MSCRAEPAPPSSPPHRRALVHWSLGTAASEGIAGWRCLTSGQPWPLAPHVSQQRWEVVMGEIRKAKM